MKYAGAAVISAFGGWALICLIKNLYIDPSFGMRLDVPGLIERVLIVFLVVIGGPYLWLIPLVIAVKVAFMIFGLSRFVGLFLREEPSLAYQKVKVKADLAADLMISPAFAILTGMVFRSF